MELFLRNIKKGFATNSSSYHSTTILSQEEYDNWVNGKIKLEIGWRDEMSYEEFENDTESEYEVDITEYTTPGGEKIVVICEHGANY